MLLLLLWLGLGVDPFISWVSSMSNVLIVLYVLDKARSKRKSRRVPEALLLTMAVLGGGLGGALVMFLIRHKNRKVSFRIVNMGSAIIWGSLIVLWLL